MPAPPGTGIVFIRQDLPGSPRIECCTQYARTDSRWTSLVKNELRIEHTEHLLAAVIGLGIDNIKVCLDGPHIPVVSNFSSLNFVEALQQAKIIEQDKPKKHFVVNQPQWVFDSFIYNGREYESILLALPSTELKVTYLLDYPGRQVPTQAAHFRLNNRQFAEQLAPARSYIMDFEYDLVAALIGQSIKDCLVIGQSEINLKWGNEPARHKLLDLMGDLATLGSPIKGHFIGIRTGHKVNIKMSQKLQGF
jgi:UDP-3-O-acyl-N-acetylglucosamine deacetylase